jgi:imidazolonepropionase-like amidohydrolase
MRLRVFLVSLSLWAPPASAETIALVGGTVHPVDAPDIPRGTVLVRDGKIAAVGMDVTVPADAKVVDVAGRHVYPALFAPFTQLGLSEINLVRSTLDVEEIGELNPEARADVAMNLDSELLPVTRSAGVLIGGISPIGGILSGSAAVMKLEGWTREDAALRAPAAVVVTWPDLHIDRSPRARDSVRVQEKRRDEAVRKLKDAFRAARAYGQARSMAGRAGVPTPDLDPKAEALLPALRREIPVLVVARDLRQIKAAIAWAREETLDVVLVGGDDAWRAADEIARAKVPVILDSVIGPVVRPDDPYDAAYGSPALLVKAGVRVALDVSGGEDDAYLARNLAHPAAAAAAFGLSRDAALAAITLEPARIFHVDDRVGSLAPGKDATLFVADGDIFDVRTRVVAAFVDGRELDLSDRHKRLYERYRNRPRPASAR